ncbi:MAG: hypothetical protein AB7P12_10125 [Alphaproteobacteria bacterium]
MESLYVKHIIDPSSALDMARDERLCANDLRTFLAFSVLGRKGTLDDALIAELAQATTLSPGVVRACILTLASFGHISFTTADPAAHEKAEGTDEPRREPGKARSLDASLLDVQVDLARLKRIGDAAARDAAALREARAAVSPGLAEFRPVSNVLNRKSPAPRHEASAEAPEPDGISGFAPVVKPADRTAPPRPMTGGDAPRDRILRGLSGWNPVDGEAGQPVAVRFSVWLRFVLTPDELVSWESWMAACPGERASWAGRYAKAKATGEDKELLQALRQQLAEVASAPPIPGGPGSLSMGPVD